MRFKNTHVILKVLQKKSENQKIYGQLTKALRPLFSPKVVSLKLADGQTIDVRIKDLAQLNLTRKQILKASKEGELEALVNARLKELAQKEVHDTPLTEDQIKILAAHQTEIIFQDLPTKLKEDLSLKEEISKLVEVAFMAAARHRPSKEVRQSISLGNTNYKLSIQDSPFQRVPQITLVKGVRKLGEGSYAKVYQLVNLSTEKTGQMEVMKVPKGHKGEKQLAQELRMEERIRTIGKGRPVLGLKSPWKPKLGGAFALGKEYEDTSLATAMATLSVEQKKIVLYQILAGVSTLHLHHIIHGDLKPSNFLVERTEDLPVGVVADFSGNGVISFDNICAQIWAAPGKVATWTPVSVRSEGYFHEDDLTLAWKYQNDIKSLLTDIADWQTAQLKLSRSLSVYGLPTSFRNKAVEPVIQGIEEKSLNEAFPLLPPPIKQTLSDFILLSTLSLPANTRALIRQKTLEGAPLEEILLLFPVEMQMQEALEAHYASLRPHLHSLMKDFLIELKNGIISINSILNEDLEILQFKLKKYELLTEKMDVSALFISFFLTFVGDDWDPNWEATLTSVLGNKVGKLLKEAAAEDYKQRPSAKELMVALGENIGAETLKQLFDQRKKAGDYIPPEILSSIDETNI